MVKESLQKYIPLSIKQERKRQGYTQTKLAQLTNLSVPTIRQIERGLGRLSSFQVILQKLNLEIIGMNLPSGKSIGDRLRLLRKRKGLSQRRVAKLVGVSVPSIIALETADKGLFKTALQVLTVLGTGAEVVSKGTKSSFYTHAGNSSNHHGWDTPKELLQQLYKVVGTFDLDPCSPTNNRRNAPVRARTYFTMEDNGLALSWFGTVFINPPYGRAIVNWIAKARDEVNNGNAKMVISLVPARTDTKWWHNYIVGYADVFLLQGRLKFGKGGQSAPFPSALIIWGASKGIIPKFKESLTDAWYIPCED